MKSIPTAIQVGVLMKNLFDLFFLCFIDCKDPTCEERLAYSCGYTCRKGCFCETGFVRNKENICIRPTECTHEEL